MKKKLSYRDKLIELAYIYDVKEIKDYVKSKKSLTRLIRGTNSARNSEEHSECNPRKILRTTETYLRITKPN